MKIVDVLKIVFQVRTFKNRMNVINKSFPNVIKDYVNIDDQFTRKTAIPQEKFLDLVNLVLTST